MKLYLSKRQKQSEEKQYKNEQNFMYGVNNMNNNDYIVIDAYNYKSKEFLKIVTWYI